MFMSGDIVGDCSDEQTAVCYLPRDFVNNKILKTDVVLLEKDLYASVKFPEEADVIADQIIRK